MSSSTIGNPQQVDPASEMEAIYQESEELRRNGASEGAILARVDERLQGLSLRLDRETAEKLAEIHAAHAPLTSAQPHFANFRAIAFVKLIFGAIVFLALCGSFIYLVVPVGRILEGDVDISSATQLAIALSLVSATAMALYFLARKPHAERDALAGSLVEKQFARRKLYFQLSSLGLVALAVCGMAIARKLLHVESSIILPTLAFIGLGYWALGRTLWRCPACGHRLSFLRRYQDTQAIGNCPACHVQLQ